LRERAEVQLCRTAEEGIHDRVAAPVRNLGVLAAEIVPELVRGDQVFAWCPIDKAADAVGRVRRAADGADVGDAG